MVEPFLGAPVASPQPPRAGSHLLHVASKMQHVGESFLLPCFLLSLLPCLLFLFASSFFLPGSEADGQRPHGPTCVQHTVHAPMCSMARLVLPKTSPSPPIPGGRLTAMRAWRSFSLSLRILCCSALSARRCSCRRRGRWLGHPRETASSLSLGTHP